MTLSLAFECWRTKTYLFQESLKKHFIWKKANKKITKKLIFFCFSNDDSTSFESRKLKSVLLRRGCFGIILMFQKSYSWVILTVTNVRKWKSWSFHEISNCYEILKITLLRSIISCIEVWTHKFKPQIIQQMTIWRLFR